MAFNEIKFCDYNCIQQIGRGTYGTVYQCKRKSDSLTVVIKEICVNFSDIKNFESVNNEIVILSKLKHPNIIGYYETFHNNHSVYIVMEYASQGSLCNYLQTKIEPLPELQVLQILSEIIMGVEYIHSKGILHRDLKCDNIFLSDGTKVKIGDFGISKILMDKSKANTVIGTPYYQSPELCQNKPYGYKSDMWAIGCILYEMCTLNKPFDATTLAGLVMKIMAAEVAPIDLSLYSISMWNLVRGLLSFEPDLRPTALQMMCYPSIAKFVYKSYASLVQ